ncbi:IalB domain containing protein [Sulfitobacter noctilucae]|uniref:invasion associated locus B family protein n=1 Tax=Sulfitobacter noctilucae TaxID=1342302 RepID=UPI00046A927D|nr:invasion associated locus B family protein [Sulfitobacter noctilucae]KIN75147.1 IalB domain containing protein [Sulfitobacter noctilucae]
MPLLARLCLLVCLSLPASLSAQTTQTDPSTKADAAAAVANGQKIGAWSVTCLAVAVNQTSCTLNQRVMRAKDNAFVADLVATRNDAGQTFIAARVPVGVYLPAGFGMRPAESDDPDEVMQFAWQVCSREVCEAVIELEPAQAEALSAEDNTMIAAFRPSAKSEPFLFQFSMTGLNEGLTAIGR